MANQDNFDKDIITVGKLGTFNVEINEDFDAVYTKTPLTDFSKQVKFSPEQFYVTEISDLLRIYGSVSIKKNSGN